MRYFALGFLFIIAVASCTAHADAVRIAIIADANVNRSTADGLVAGASRIWAQAGVDIEVVSYDTANVPAGTNPAALLDDVKLYPRPEGVTLVWLTLRPFEFADHTYYGYSTVGPACSQFATALVHLEFDGTDDITLAHELGHSLGLEHDQTYGWLMSEGTTGSRTLSPESLAKLPALMACHVAKPVQAATEARTNGGGGCLSLGWLLVFALLLVLAKR